METMDDDHGVESIRTYVRNQPDINVHTYVKRGLSGLVYLGRRNKAADEVVLKFYWAEPGYDSSEEAVILLKIDHPNILRVFDLKFVPPNASCFLTPWISGGDLQGQLDNRSFSTREALEIISDILLGITELHANHRLVHRDLKPGNILLDIDRNRSVIADLGAVKRINSPTGFTSESKGALYYLPPESIVDKKYYFQSDIYQIGLILFQLLDGFFPASNPEKWLTKKEKQFIDSITIDSKKFDQLDEYIKEKIYKGKLADTRTLPSHLDAGFKRVLNKALHLDYKKRFKNTSEFLKEIHKLLNNFPSYLMQKEELIVTHGSGKEYRIRKNEHGIYTLEKRLPGKDWRADRTHDGNFESVITLARIN